MAETMKPTDPDNEDAPFGFNDDGTPLAPYGMKTNGKPRVTNRGRRPGSGTGSTTSSTRKAATTRKPAETDMQRKAALMQLSEIFIEAPLAAASTSSMLQKRIGEAQTDALAGDALIWNFYSPSLADGLIAYSQQKPRVLSWLDGVQEKAPLLMLAQVGVQMTKAFIGNHMEPDPNVAKSGRRLVRMNVAKMARAINEEAEAMGIPTEDEVIANMRAQQGQTDAAA